MSSASVDSGRGIQEAVYFSPERPNRRTVASFAALDLVLGDLTAKLSFGLEAMHSAIEQLPPEHQRLLFPLSMRAVEDAHRLELLLNTDAICGEARILFLDQAPADGTAASAPRRRRQPRRKASRRSK